MSLGWGMCAKASPTDAASLVDSSAEAAFAAAEDGRIVAWNAAAKSLLGVAADEAIGQACYELLAGIDIFGNLYCRAACAPREMLRCKQPVQGFILDLKRDSGEFLRVDVSVVAIQGAEASEHTLVHLIRPVSESVEPNHFLERMRTGAHRAHEASAPEARPERPTGSSVATKERADTRASQQALTQREIEILRLLADGRNPEKIAETLGVRVSTIRTHIQNILHKLKVHSAINAVSEALRRRLI